MLLFCSFYEDLTHRSFIKLLIITLYGFPAEYLAAFRFSDIGNMTMVTVTSSVA